MGINDTLSLCRDLAQPGRYVRPGRPLGSEPPGSVRFFKTPAPVHLYIRVTSSRPGASNRDADLTRYKPRRVLRWGSSSSRGLAASQAASYGQRSTRTGIVVRQGLAVVVVVLIGVVGGKAAEGQGGRQEKRNCIEAWLKIHTEWADNWIAEDLGVNNETVKSRREHLESACGFRKLDKLLGKDGKWYSREQDTLGLACGEVYHY